MPNGQRAAPSPAPAEAAGAEPSAHLIALVRLLARQAARDALDAET
jgi:hypothetical protein